MVEPLVIPFVVVVRDELAAGETQRALADQDQALEGFVRLTLRAAQYRDAHSTIPLPSASLSA